MGKSGVLQFTGSQRVGHHLVTEQHGPLGLLPPSESFPKVATEHLLLSLSEKFSSLLNFLVKALS